MAHAASYSAEALSTAEKLSRQRQAAALARGHAHAMQVKVVVTCGCVLVGALGFAVHRGSVVNAAQPALQTTVATAAAINEARIGQIQLPDEGDKCRQYHFDNKTGTMAGDLVVTCTALELRPAEPGPSRTESIMSAFRVSR